MERYQFTFNENELREVRIAVDTRIEFLENLIEDLKNIDDKEQSDIDNINSFICRKDLLRSIYSVLLFAKPFEL